VDEHTEAEEEAETLALLADPDPHADERARTGSRPAERPRRRSGGAVLSPEGADPLTLKRRPNPLRRTRARSPSSGGDRARLRLWPLSARPSRRPRLPAGAQSFLRQYELIERVHAYDPTADEALLNRAYVYAMRMHGSQTRASGDPYYAHPIEVAGILTEYRLDTATIVTALLHDVIEDTPVTKEEIAKLFGDEIAELVEGVTKLSKLELSGRAHAPGREPAQVHPGHQPRTSASCW
jgi:hypothetical protein